MIHMLVFNFDFRLQLAALHFNENSSRSQATTNEGKERFAMRFPKFKKGQATVSKVLTDATYGKYFFLQLQPLAVKCNFHKLCKGKFFH